MRNLLIIINLIIAGFLFSCNDNRIYEHNFEFKNSEWHIDTVPVFPIEADEKLNNCNLVINVRNGINYPYYNLFLKYEILDSVRKKIREEQVEFIIMDPKTGQPLGSGSVDLFFHKFLIAQNFKFPYKGKFYVRLIQYMREEKLKGIQSVGLRIEKAKS